MGKRLSVIDKLRRAVEGASPTELQDAAEYLKRKANLAIQMVLRPGMRVVCAEGVGNRLQPGAIGVVTKVNPKTVAVDFKETVGEASRYRQWKMRPSHIQPIEDAA